MYQPPKRRRISKAERQEVYEKCRGHCAYCGKEISISEMNVDHLIPMEFYYAYYAVGIDIDAMHNFMPACRSCNNYKSSMTLERFRKAAERWPEVLMRDSVTYRNAVRFGMVKPTPHPVVFYFEQMDGRPCDTCEHWDSEDGECSNASVDYGYECPKFENGAIANVIDNK